MPRITVPPDHDPRTVAWSLTGEIGRRAEELSDAVHASLALPVREFEAARMRVAQINNCRVCLGYRALRDSPVRRDGSAEVIPEEFYESIREWQTAPLTVRERLAAEFADRFATDHGSLERDETFWARLHGGFTDEEIVNLTIAIASCLALGRFAHVLDIDGACRVLS